MEQKRQAHTRQTDHRASPRSTGFYSNSPKVAPGEVLHVIHPTHALPRAGTDNSRSSTRPNNFFHLQKYTPSRNSHIFDTL